MSDLKLSKPAREVLVLLELHGPRPTSRRTLAPHWVSGQSAARLVDRGLARYCTFRDPLEVEITRRGRVALGLEEDIVEPEVGA